MGLISTLIGAVGAVSASLPDPRKGPLRADAFRMADIVLSAFSLFFIGNPSFLAWQRRLFRQTLDAAGPLTAFRRPDNRVLIALDGTEHFCSRKLHCPRCLHRRRADGGESR